VTADEDGETLGFLKSLAERTGATVHGARTMVGADGRGLNLATVVGPGGGVLVEYAKVHPFSLGTPCEAGAFAAGGEVVVYEWGGGGTPEVRPPPRALRAGGGTREDMNPPPSPLPLGGGTKAAEALKVCPAICYDLRFPELFRRGLLMGAEVFAIGSNWPANREFHRRALSIARAIENQAFVLSVNRTGRDPGLEYPGGTLAISPRGEVLGELGSEEGVMSVEIDPGDVRRWRSVFPAWRDHRLLEK
jgi:predicted amidohydrolase